MWREVGPYLRLEVHHDGDRAVVRLDGELDLASSPELLDLLPELFTNGTSVIVLDLARVTFCDAAGVRTLLALDDHASASGRQLLLGPVSRQLRRVLDLTGAMRKFDVHDSGRSSPVTVLSPVAHTVLDETLDTAIRVSRADMGTAQLVDSASGALRIVSHRGFDDPFLKFFAVADHAACCGVAHQQARPIFVADVEASPIFTDTSSLAVMLHAGARAVASIPVIAPDDSVVAVISVHYRRPVEWVDQQARLLSQLAASTARKLVVSA